MPTISHFYGITIGGGITKFRICLDLQSEVHFLQVLLPLKKCLSGA